MQLRARLSIRGWQQTGGLSAELLILLVGYLINEANYELKFSAPWYLKSSAAHCKSSLLDPMCHSRKSAMYVTGVLHSLCQIWFFHRQVLKYCFASAPAVACLCIPWCVRCQRIQRNLGQPEMPIVGLFFSFASPFLFLLQLEKTSHCVLCVKIQILKYLATISHTLHFKWSSDN